MDHRQENCDWRRPAYVFLALCGGWLGHPLKDMLTERSVLRLVRA